MRGANRELVHPSPSRSAPDFSRIKTKGPSTSSDSTLSRLADPPLCNVGEMEDADVEEEIGRGNIGADEDEEEEEEE